MKFSNFKENIQITFTFLYYFLAFSQTKGMQNKIFTGESQLARINNKSQVFYLSIIILAF